MVVEMVGRGVAGMPYAAMLAASAKAAPASSVRADSLPEHDVAEGVDLLLGHQFGKIQ